VVDLNMDGHCWILVVVQIATAPVELVSGNRGAHIRNSVPGPMGNGCRSELASACVQNRDAVGATH